MLDGGPNQDCRYWWTGGGGRIRTKLVARLRQQGHDLLPASPGSGLNPITCEALNEALAGAQVVVDLANSPSFEAKQQTRDRLSPAASGGPEARGLGEERARPGKRACDQNKISTFGETAMKQADEWLENNPMLVEALLTAARARLVMVALDASLIEAARLLHTGTDLVVACDTEGKFTGVITKADTVGKIAQGHRSDSVDLPSLVVSREVVLCRPSDNLADIWSLMKKRGFKNVPVIDEENRPIGVLNLNDVLQVQLDEAKYEDAALRDYVMGVGYR